MAVKPKEPPGPPPEPVEVTDAIAAWRTAADLAAVARDVEVEARRHLVDVLHRAGLQGFSL